MITVYVLVTFIDATGVHKAGTITKVKEEDFDPRYMKKITPPSPGGSTVDVTQIVSSGTKIATITVDDEPTDIYAPEDTGSDVSVTQVVSTGTKIATVTVDDTPTDLYAPNPGDKVVVTQVQSTGTKIASIKVNNNSTDLYAPAGGQSSSGVVLKANRLAEKILDHTYTYATISDGVSAADLCAKLLGGESVYVRFNSDKEIFEISGLCEDTSGTAPTPFPYYGVMNLSNQSLTKTYKVKLQFSGSPAVASRIDFTEVTSGSEVSVTQVLSSGTKIATVTVDGNDTDLYAPAGGGGGGSAPSLVGSFEKNDSSIMLGSLESDYSQGGTFSDSDMLNPAAFCFKNTHQDGDSILTCDAIGIYCEQTHKGYTSLADLLSEMPLGQSPYVYLTFWFAGSPSAIAVYVKGEIDPGNPTEISWTGNWNQSSVSYPGAWPNYS